MVNYFMNQHILLIEHADEEADMLEIGEILTLRFWYFTVAWIGLPKLTETVNKDIDERKIVSLWKLKAFGYL